MAAPAESDTSILAVVFATSLLSVIGSVLILYQYMQLPFTIKRRMFARQMFHLALADLFSSLAHIPIALMEFSTVIDPTTHEAGLRWCQATAIPFITFAAVSASVEIHISMAFFYAQFGFIKTLRCHERMLLLNWPICIAVALFTTRSVLGYREGTGRCIGIETSASAYQVIPCLMLFCFMVPAAAYVSTLCKAIGRTPAGVQQRVLMRNLLYPLNYFVTYLPMATFLTFSQLHESSAFLGFALFSFSLNGFLNALTYAFIFNAFRNMANGQAINHSPESDPLGCTSFHVRFRGGADVHDIGMDTFEANTTAEGSWIGGQDEAGASSEEAAVDAELAARRQAIKDRRKSERDARRAEKSARLASQSRSGAHLLEVQF